jgi:methionyl-tRNA formyltransferase
MKIFFIGTVDFSRSMLLCLLELDVAEIVGIATKAVSKFNSDHTDLSDIAIKKKIPFKHVGNINEPQVVDWIRSLNPDVIYCMGWSSLIKSELLQLCSIGVIGFHPAKLPQNRGRHPLIWALVLGLSESATTFFLMDEGTDSGEILSQEIFTIDEEDAASDVYKKMIDCATSQIKSITLRLASGNYETQKQDHSKANYWRKRGKGDGRIDFRMGSKSIFNLVRALAKPYAGAHIEYNGGEYKVWHVDIGPVEHPNSEPGKILARNENGHFLVKTGDGSIWVRNHELELTKIKLDYLI